MLSHKKTVRLLGLVLAFLLVAGAQAQDLTQEFAKGRIFLANGLNLEGKNLRLTMESATLEIMGQDQTFLFEDVIQIMAKKGKAKRFGRISAGSFMGLILLAALTNPEDAADDQDGTDDGTQNEEGGLGGLLVVGGISYGAGYLLGHISDDWRVVYLKRG